MAEWKKTSLGELVDIGSSKRIFYKEYVAEGIPFYRSKEVIEKHNRHAVSTELQISNERYNEIKEKFGVPIEGDMLLTSVGTLGIPYIVQKDEIFYFKDGNLTWFRNFNTNFLNQFLYYWIISPIGKSELDMVSIGSTQSALTIKGLKSITINSPPLPEQKAIASVLSSLDDKIDLLHRQNKTLEAMAETLFRQWFVEEADEGWEANSLLEIIQLIGGGTPKTAISEYWNGDIPWLSGGDIASNHKSFINCSLKSITEVGLNNSSAKLLPKYATVISARGTVGKYCLLAQPMAFSQSNYGILPKPKISKCFFLTYLLVNHVVEELQSSAHGSVFDTITTTTFKEIKVHLPTEIEILRFEQSVSPYFKKMFLNKSQIRTLEKFRDTLLPKLMGGEVRVMI